MKLLLENWRRFLKEDKQLSLFKNRRAIFIKKAKDLGAEYSNIDDMTRQIDAFEFCDENFFSDFDEIDSDAFDELTRREEDVCDESAWDSPGEDMAGDPIPSYEEMACQRVKHCQRSLDKEGFLIAFNKWKTLSPDDRFPSETEKEHIEKVRQRGRILKKIFDEVADRKFLQTIVTVHWVEEPLTILHQAGRNKNKLRGEISAHATRPGEFTGGGLTGEYGILLDGHISLLAKDMNQVKSGYEESYKKHLAKKVKMSGIKRGVFYLPSPEEMESDFGFVLDGETWGSSEGHKRDGMMWNEAFVANPKIKAIILPKEGRGRAFREMWESRRDDAWEDYLEMIEESASKIGVPVWSFKEAKRKL